MEIDHYGERLIGCTECNRWSWRGAQRLLLELPDDDIDALRERVRRAKQAGMSGRALARAIAAGTAISFSLIAAWGFAAFTKVVNCNACWSHCKSTA